MNKKQEAAERHVIYMDYKRWKKMKKLSKAKGVTISSILRKAVDFVERWL